MENAYIVSDYMLVDHPLASVSASSSEIQKGARDALRGFLRYLISHGQDYLRGCFIMARLAARGKDLFIVNKKRSFDGSGGEIITRIETELRYQDNGNLLRRVRTFFKPGFLDKNKNFVSSGWQLEARGIPMTASELLGTLLKAGFTKTKILEEEK
jgi:hypothetical protein